MKQLIKKAIATRKRLNKRNLSHPGFESVQFIKNLEYWLANGADIDTIVLNHRTQLRIMMTSNFKKQFDEKLQS